ncbi:MAG: hypothetical protein U0931_25310 [Vulcanimicrobiota bacterium]
MNPIHRWSIGDRPAGSRLAVELSTPVRGQVPVVMVHLLPG